MAGGREEIRKSGALYARQIVVDALQKSFVDNSQIIKDEKCSTK
jgi:hypothetical protein